MADVPHVQARARLPHAERVQVGARLLREYQAGKSIRQLCVETGYSIGRMRRLLQDAGVEFRRRGGGSAGTPPTHEAATNRPPKEHR